jgi:hypothetical protein
MELRQLVDMMLDNDEFVAIVNNPLAQFGPKNRRYLGPSLLPEVRKTQNVYKETYIQYRSIIANAGTRYSPPQIKGNALIGSMTVELAESDIASDFTAQDYDTVLDLIAKLDGVTEISQVPPRAVTTLLRWVDITINRPLLEFNEYCRWQAIVDAEVQLRGDNNFSEDVLYSNPSGHRFAAGDSWSDDTYDPYDDIVAGYNKLIEKGYNVSRMITSNAVKMILLNNAKIKQRLGFLAIAGGSVVGLPGVASLDALNARLQSDGLPSIETYDLQYKTSTSTQYFLARDVFVMVATTDRDEDIDTGEDNVFTVTSTLGYVGIGRPANRATSGRATVVEYNDKKGAPVTAQGWQTSLPVITAPEAIVVITDID